VPDTSKPILVFDGDCSFCRLWIDRWKHLTGDRVEYVPYQQVSSRFPEIPIEQFKSAVQFIEPSGERTSAAQAVFRLLTYAPGKAWMNWAYDNVPPVAPLSEAVYRFVAGQRSALYSLTQALWGQHFERPSYELVRWLFLRLLAMAYLFAFLSLAVQITGLVGLHGILPVQNLLQAASERAGADRYWMLPTLAWLGSSDAALRAMCWGGALVSLLGLIGVFPLLAFAAAWALYLSLIVAGQEFLSFQWDILLIETGFLAILFAPFQILPAPARREPSRKVLFVLRVLLFRLMFGSGVVKLAGGDPAWRHLRALDFHYYTQPLPTPLAWFMQQLPAWFQTTSTAVMFGIELVVPFFFFAPRRLRLWAAGLTAFLEVLILLTGNYAFFNLLALALCVTLLDDACLLGRIPQWLVNRIMRSDQQQESRFRRVVAAVLVALILFAGVAQVAATLGHPLELPEPAADILGLMGHWYIVNGYGLFAVMTTTRYEIIVEGSNDAATWLPYEFKYKPGDLNRRPPIVAPHQPRLDWQMWFAALGDYRSNPWFVNFVVRLLEGAPDVLPLLAKNPFPNAPPRYIRAELYDYHFTNFAERRATGAWWRRDYVRLYFPVASLRGGQ
jgi:predicted DCC family thiol-disulfide oxidoreductase YuxK